MINGGSDQPVLYYWYVAFLQTLVAVKKSRLWVGIAGSEKNRLWCLAIEMSGKQRYSRCSKWSPSARIHVFFASDQLHRPPRSAKIQPMSQRFRIADWYSICMKKMKKMKNLRILQGTAMTFLGVVVRE